MTPLACSTPDGDFLSDDFSLSSPLSVPSLSLSRIRSWSRFLERCSRAKGLEFKWVMNGGISKTRIRTGDMNA
jgi:hypothetical protein